MKLIWKTLLVLFVLANSILMVWFWSQTSGAMLSLPWSVGSPAVAWGRISGLLLEFALLIQLVLIGRISWIEQAFGHDGLNRIHRLVGYWLVALLIAHPLLLSVGYGLMQSRGVVPAFIGLATQWENVLNAVLGVLLLFGVIALSVPWVRRRLKYEYWHLAHLLTYVAIALAFGHQIENGGDFRSGALTAYWYILNFGVFGLYFLYRFLRPVVVYAKHRFVVERVERVSPDAWSIVIAGRNMPSFRFRAGQFAILQFAARGLWTPHPFSFSQEYNGNTLRFTVKELGDATKSIEALRSGTRVLIDGPLGVFTPKLAKTEKYLLIAGGIGVTPIRAMAGELSARGADVVVLYAVRNIEHSALADEINRAGVPMKMFISQPGVHTPDGAVAGIIDAAAIRQFVPDVAGRDVYICGPSTMMNSLWSEARALGVPRSRIHREQFGYGGERVPMPPGVRRVFTSAAFLGAGVLLGWLIFAVLLDTKAPDSIVEPIISVQPTRLTPTLSRTPMPSTAASRTPTPPPAGIYSMAQVAVHNSGSNCWTVIGGSVYDITPFIDAHPGGSGTVLPLCGTDGTAAFDNQHGGKRKPAQELAGFKIGVLAQ